MKLISCTEFVKDQWSIDLNASQRDRIKNYANFLLLPLTLGMFIPTNEKGEVLEEPNKKYYQSLKDVDKAIWEYDRLLDEFHEAKQRVIFEGCELIKEHQYSWSIQHDNQNYIFHKNFTIEDLIDLNITITEKAINQFKLR